MGIWVQIKRKRLVWLKTTVPKMTQMWPKKAVFVPKIGFLTQKVGTKFFALDFYGFVWRLCSNLVASMAVWRISFLSFFFVLDLA